MKMAFNGGGSVRQQQRWGIQTGNDEATMEINISGGGWQQPASAFDGRDGTMRGREGGATRRQRVMMVQQPAGATRQREVAQ
jgi:hypothetical protein